MRVVFNRPKDTAPAKMLAEFVLLDFIEVFPSIKLGGFSVWTGEKGLWVKVPGRQYQKNGQTKSFDLFTGERGDIDAFKAGVLKRFEEWQASQPARSENDGEGGQESAPDYENPFA